MHVSEIKVGHSDKEVAMLNSQIKRTQALCHAIYKHYGYLYEIKNYIAEDRLLGAKELFAELDYRVQKLLMIAPTKGGPFTTKERAIMKTLWSVTVEDIENS